jgi:hypothetical protein
MVAGRGPLRPLSTRRNSCEVPRRRTSVITMPDEASPQDMSCPSVAEFTKSNGVELLRFAYLVPPGRAADGTLVGLTEDRVWWGDLAAGQTAVITLAPNRITVLDTATLPTLHC